MPIDWDYALAELRGEMAPSYTDGSGALGVNNGGKYSVDVTYIAAAEATGLVTVQAQHEVKDIERASDGRWTVYVDRIDTSGKLLENKILTTDTLILAAGSLNTTRLLVRASQKGQIPDLPDDLGRNWGSNADRIYLWSDMREDFGALQGGPVVYGSKNWDDPNTAFTVIQASIPAMGLNTRSTVLVGYGISDSAVRSSTTPRATTRSCTGRGMATQQSRAATSIPWCAGSSAIQASPPTPTPSCRPRGTRSAGRAWAASATSTDEYTASAACTCSTAHCFRVSPVRATRR